MNRPKPLGFRGLSLLLPSISSAIGFFCFAVLAYSFTEIQDLSAGFRRALVIVGAFTLAFGSEVGTLAQVVEIYRKPARVLWDWLALVISGAATVTSFVLAFAVLILRDLAWVSLLRDYGAVVLGILAALDSYGGFMEFGLYLNSHDARIDTWEQRTVAEAERRERMIALIGDAEEPAHSHTQPLTPVADDPIEARRARLLTHYRAQPDATQAAVAETLGVSASTVRNDLAALEDAGRIIRTNGQVEVV